jgi:FkbM family methyltransferase
MFRRLDIRCALDVGANRGQYRRFLREEVRFDGLIVSFEPVRNNAVLMRREAERCDPKWIVLDYALGNDDGVRPFNVMKLDLLSSFMEPDNTIVPALSSLNAVDRVEQVTIRKLDSVIDTISRMGDVRNLFMKIDTQGFDLDVVRGAASTLHSVLVLQAELSMRPIYRNMPTYQVLIDELSLHGFGITGMFPVSRDNLMRVIEFDCVAINGKDHLVSEKII